MYLLDTCVISDFVKGNPLTLHTIKSHAPKQLYVSTITLMEIEYGLQRIPQRRHEIDKALRIFLKEINTQDFTAIEAIAGGNLRCALSKKGTPIGAYDVLIAATALINQMVLVTDNTKEFQRVKGLKVENWRR